MWLTKEDYCLLVCGLSEDNLILSRGLKSEEDISCLALLNRKITLCERQLAVVSEINPALVGWQLPLFGQEVLLLQKIGKVLEKSALGTILQQRIGREIDLVSMKTKILADFPPIIGSADYLEIWQLSVRLGKFMEGLPEAESALELCRLDESRAELMADYLHFFKKYNSGVSLAETAFTIKDLDHFKGFFGTLETLKLDVVDLVGGLDYKRVVSIIEKEIERLNLIDEALLNAARSGVIPTLKFSAAEGELLAVAMTVVQRDRNLSMDLLMLSEGYRYRIAAGTRGYPEYRFDYSGWVPVQFVANQLLDQGLRMIDANQERRKVTEKEKQANRVKIQKLLTKLAALKY